MSADKSVAEIHRRFSSTPAKVFAAFADKDLVSHWLSPSPDVRLSVLEFEFRVGGVYRFAYHVPGGQVMTVNGSFRVIEPPTKIAFSWIIEPPDEHAGIHSEVTVSITPSAGGTELLIRHEKLVRTDAIGRHAEGWRGALDRLTSLLAAEIAHGR